MVVPDSARGELALARADARVVARYEDFSLVEATGDDVDRLRDAGAGRRDDMREVVLAGGRFDPVRRPSLAAKDAPERSEALVLVQFAGPVKETWLARLRATGATVLGYAAQNGYIVHAAGDALVRVSELVGSDPTVRAATALRPADKVERGAEGGRVAVQTVAGAPGRDARREAAAGGRRLAPELTAAHVRTQFLDLTATAVADLAADPAVVAIEPAGVPELHDERAAQIVAGNLAGNAPSGPGYEAWLLSKGFGAPFGFAIDVTDSGLDRGDTALVHPDLLGRVGYAHDYTLDPDATDCGGHGTNVASIAAGLGTAAGGQDAQGYKHGLGVAPYAQVGASKIFRCTGAPATVNYAQLTADAYGAGARISNNSWGISNFGGYHAASQAYDALVRDASSGTPGNQELVEVFSAGNDGDGNGDPLDPKGDEGYGSITSPGTAKNVITVGASESPRPLGRITCGVDDGGADRPGDVIEFSSRGPTDDGRLKPDLVAPGTRLVGAAPRIGALYEGFGVCQKFFPTAGNAFYSMQSGTSQAAPAVSGAAALIRSWYRREHGGNAPSPAMTKAILVDSAKDLTGGDNGKGDVIASAPNSDQGWGRAHLGAALDTTQRDYVDQTSTFGASGERFARTYTVDNPTKPLKVTLAWTDAPGMVGGAVPVNNLDLVVRHRGRTYRGNVLAGGRSITGGDADRYNNLESVALPPQVTGQFSVEVFATSIAGNGVPEVGDDLGDTDQDFALVVSNAEEQENAPVLAPVRAAIADPGPNGDGDGFLETDESFRLAVDLHNGGDSDATNVSGSISGPSLSFTQANANWASVPEGTVAPANAPFAGRLASNAACGADVTPMLALSQGASPLPVTLRTGEPGVPATSSRSHPAPLAIPDERSAGVTSTIAVTTPGLVKDLDVTLGNLSHSWVGDLVIELTSPAGTTVRLAQHPGGPDNSNNNFIGTVFDDEAPTNISAGRAPYTGRFRPQNDQLSRFDGQQRRGTWTLRVRDLAQGDTGSLTSWSTTTRRAICDFTDRVAPNTAITSGPSGTASSRSASFRFTSTESGSIFECSLDGAPPTSCEPQHTVAGLRDGAHTLRVWARDLADHLDPSAAERRWTVDATAPEVSLSTPRPGAPVRESRPRLAGSGGVAPGDFGTITVMLWRGTLAAGSPAQVLAVPRDPATGAWSTRPAALGDGSWTARAQQRDAIGHTGVSPPVTFTVNTADKTAPDYAVVPVQSDRSEARANRLTVLAGCGSACRVSAELRVARQRGPVLGRARATLAAQRSRAIRVNLTRTGRAALRRASTLKAKLRVTVDGAGAPLTLNQSIVLREIDVGRFARRGLAFAGRCSERCSIAGSLLMRARDARRHGFRAPGSAPVRVAGATATSPATSAKLVLRVKKASRKRLARARRVNLTMEASVRAPTGPGHRTSYRLTLGH
jgi:subtilisin-like proprotein convertase family protein